MKKKIILITLIGTIISFIIYFYTQNNDITIVSLGDGVSTGMTPYLIEGYSYNDYLKDDYKTKHELKAYYEYGSPNMTIKELIYDIKQNKRKEFKNKKIEIQHAINEADILTIGIGMDELVNIKLTRDLKKEFTSNLEELFSLIKLLNNNKVIILSLYHHNNLDILTTSKLNAIIRDISLSNNFIYIDINNIIKDEYYLNKNSHYLNYNAHQAIYEEIKKYL